ncbi:hypothetical protein LTR28_007918 [Elasticomyces elasticus]|nr:hypothetical protein LTR28_007918 [Elasticomyces elasticus]
MSGARHWEQDKEATCYVGNLDERVTDELVWELMLQAGRIVNVHLPKDRVTQNHQGYGFVEFISEEDAEYAAKIMNAVRLWGKPIRVNKASADKQKTVEVGAELFVGNLDPMVDEKMLFETFSRFGSLVSAPKLARDDNNLSKGYGFISFSNFESSDEAIANMHGQYLMNKEVTVQYAYKKDGKGERHGDEAERRLAAQARKNNVAPTMQPLPPHLTAPYAPSAPSAMLNGDMSGIPGTPRGPSGGYGGMTPGGYGGPPSGGYGGGGAGYQNMMPPPHMQHPRHMMGHNQPPLQPPPSAGLPARPPAPQAGYGGPQQYGGPPPGYASGPPAPYGNGAQMYPPPSPYGPGGYPAPGGYGMGAPPMPGMPMGMPPGMPPPPGYQQRR